MSEYTLYLGNKAYSSWSLRGWLAVKLAGLPFAEVVKDMGAADWPDFVRRVSPSARVPVLEHGNLRVWESIAIAEYAAELAPQAGLWPEDRTGRAHARTIAAEMHAGFASLRQAMWMNTRRRFPGKGRTPGALADIARIVELWRDTRTRYGAGGPFLFGARFTLADAMYAPVVSRFVTWEPELPADAKSYVEAVWEHALLREWRQAADAEPWTIAKYEAPGP
jgi:glutathione S-transferase